MPEIPEHDPVWTDERLVALARSAERSFVLKTPAGLPASAPPTISGYQIIRLLGSGGMGSVWLAQSDEEQAGVAIKILHSCWAADADISSRFEMEVDLLADLTHPHIVALLDAGETTDHRLFLATEYVDGCDLSHLLRGGPIPALRALEIFRKVVAAVSHAHSRGIIHRDLKPANILLGKDDLVKVTDFGLAKHFSVSATRPTDAFGSPYYLAPELTRSASAASPASDVYSLAVLWYEMLAGKLPLGAYTPLSSLGYDRRMDRAIRNALRDDPSARTAAVDRLLDEIERSWETSRKRSLWKKRAPWAVAAGMLLLGVGAGYAWHGNHRKPQRPVFPAAERATISAPWQNSLGMRFIPVPGCDVLFSIHETRNSEWRVFRAMEESMKPAWRMTDDGGAPANRPVMGLQGWEAAPDDSDPALATHPAQGVSWQDTQFFCNWLTLKERQEGRLTARQYYRLPTDAEWSIAAGTDGTAVLVGNYAGPEARTGKWPDRLPTRTEADPFSGTSPAGSFAPAASGLFDLGGNALEWVDDVSGLSARDEENAPRPLHTLRGGSWAYGKSEDLQIDHRTKARSNRRRVDFGFRCVLVLRDEKNP